MGGKLDDEFVLLTSLAPSLVMSRMNFTSLINIDHVVYAFLGLNLMT